MENKDGSENIFKKKLDEEQIKKCIEENRAKEPKLNPVPNSIPNIDYTRSEEIYVKLDDEFNVSNFLPKEDIINKIFELKYDYEKMVYWIEDLM